ncbi:MAG TPA: 2-C-methyl-D-erythritol 4-phosphate cytidylyltransferase [Candidatus Dormibacteraeota bacterium]|nr:2-C-methyl-D-erythritol 4-phosphate cytidylyltransferase [Candidatus Dormibacteraeota bacterium]
MTARAAAVVLAAGSGKRMGAGVNKVFLPLGDRPVLGHTLQIFESHPGIGRVVLVAAPGEEDHCLASVVEALGLGKVTAVVPGGATRHRSEFLGLLALAGPIEAGEIDVVLIHDAARPFVAAGEIDDLIATAARCGAAILAAPADGDGILLQTADGRLEEPPAGLWAALTPQAFDARMVLEAHRAADGEGFEGTDTASVVERRGTAVHVVEGSRRNIKITTREDLRHALRILEGGTGDAPL